MSRFHGKVGYELPGQLVKNVWTANVEERDLYGDILNETRSLEPSDKVNDDFRVQHRISVMADAFLLENYAKIKYVEMGGGRWTVTSVQIQRPRLILTLGGVYRGKLPA